LTIPAGIDARRKNKGSKKPSRKPKLQADTALPLLHDLAMHQMHSWRDEGLPIPELVARYRAGEILYVACGGISHTGVHVLRDAGYSARVVGVVTQQPFNGVDGHIMLEVWQQGAWRLYDIDGNRRAVDSAGRGVNIVTQVAQVAAGGGHIWEEIADDPRSPGVYVPDPTWTQETLDARVFGTPWIVLSDDATEAFHDATDRARLEAMGHRYLDKKAWDRLIGKP
jgi:hypothetical protein